MKGARGKPEISHFDTFEKINFEDSYKICTGHHAILVTMHMEYMHSFFSTFLSRK